MKKHDDVMHNNHETMNESEAKLKIANKKILESRRTIQSLTNELQAITDRYNNLLSTLQEKEFELEKLRGRLNVSSYTSSSNIGTGGGASSSAGLPSHLHSASTYSTNHTSSGSPKHDSISGVTASVPSPKHDHMRSSSSKHSHEYYTSAQPSTSSHKHSSSATSDHHHHQRDRTLSPTPSQGSTSSSRHRTHHHSDALPSSSHAYANGIYSHHDRDPHESTSFSRSQHSSYPVQPTTATRSTHVETIHASSSHRTHHQHGTSSSGSASGIAGASSFLAGNNIPSLPSTPILTGTHAAYSNATGSSGTHLYQAHAVSVSGASTPNSSIYSQSPGYGYSKVDQRLKKIQTTFAKMKSTDL